MNPETAITEASPSRAAPSAVTNSQNPSRSSVPYSPFGSSHTCLPNPPVAQRPRLNLAPRNPSSDQDQAQARPEPTRNDRESSPHHQSSTPTRITEQHARPSPRSNSQSFCPRQAISQSNGSRNVFPNNYYTAFPALPNSTQYTPLGTTFGLVVNTPTTPNPPRGKGSHFPSLGTAPSGASARPPPPVPGTQPHPHPQHQPPTGNQGSNVMTAEALDSLRINQAQADLDRINRNADRAYRFANRGRGGRGRGNEQGRGW